MCLGLPCKDCTPPELLVPAGIKISPLKEQAAMGKLRYDLVPEDALEEIVKVITYGAEVKYKPRDWERGVKYGIYYAAAQRHLKDFWQGRVKDPDTGFHLLAHAGCCILFLLAFEMRGMGLRFDDRLEQIIKKEVEDGHTNGR